jgi:hypothetical protein
MNYTEGSIFQISYFSYRQDSISLSLFFFSFFFFFHNTRFHILNQQDAYLNKRKKLHGGSLQAKRVDKCNELHILHEQLT